jgi:Ca2+-binding RTX toxin-like protein
MRAARTVVTLALGASVVIVGPMARPASASVALSTVGGSTVQVEVVGEAAITTTCESGKVAVNAVVALPPVDCTALTVLSVVGDGARQEVYGLYLNGWPSQPRVVADLGGGPDLFWESLGSDDVDLGPGDDVAVTGYGGSDNAGIDLGAGAGDELRYTSAPADDDISVTSTGDAVAIDVNSSAGSGRRWASGCERLTIDGNDGNDSIDTTGIAAASVVTHVSVFGGGGHDQIEDGQLSSDLYGGEGTNALVGGSGHDTYWSTSSTDHVDGGHDAFDEDVHDLDSLSSGGRQLAGLTEGDTYVMEVHRGDAIMRVRPAAADSVLVASSLSRPGEQVVPAPVGRISLDQSDPGTLGRQGLADVVATNRAVEVALPSSGLGLLDVTIPTGTWDVSSVGGTLTITSEYGPISASSTAASRSSVHGPWSDDAQRFAHRVTRDLLLRFASEGEREQLRGQLVNGTKTRAAAAREIIETDAYRGLDVDRVFLEYLRRPADPGGRTYWINSIRNGKALWRFRAQLFGGSEYFTKAGGTNAKYVATAYSDVLGRKPDPSGQAYWTNKLNRGAGRGSVALQFINSPEARRRLVDEQFLRLLDRAPTTGEQTTWVAKIPGATGEQQLIASLAASQEYAEQT